jgi:hypothetical protein
MTNAQSDTPQQVFYSPVTDDIAHSCKNGNAGISRFLLLKSFDDPYIDFLVLHASPQTLYKHVV